MLKYFLLAFVVFALAANAQDDEEEEPRGAPRPVRPVRPVHPVRPVYPIRPVHPIRPVFRDLPATPEIDAMVRKVEREVREIIGQHKVKKFKAESYQKNFPITDVKVTRGSVYFVKVNTGDCRKRTILRIFSDANKRSIILQGIKTGTVKTHPIEYFDGNLDQFRD